MHDLYGRVWVAALALDAACGLLEHHGLLEPPEPTQCIAGPLGGGDDCPVDWDAPGSEDIEWCSLHPCAPLWHASNVSHAAADHAPPPQVCIGSA